MIYSLLLTSVMLTNCPAKPTPTVTQNHSSWLLTSCLCSIATNSACCASSKRSRGCKRSSNRVTRMSARLWKVLPAVWLGKSMNMPLRYRPNRCSKRSGKSRASRIKRLRKRKKRRRRQPSARMKSTPVFGTGVSR